MRAAFISGVPASGRNPDVVAYFIKPGAVPTELAEVLEQYVVLPKMSMGSRPNLSATHVINEVERRTGYGSTRSFVRTLPVIWVPGHLRVLRIARSTWNMRSTSLVLSAICIVRHGSITSLLRSLTPSTSSWLLERTLAPFEPSEWRGWTLGFTWELNARSCPDRQLLGGFDGAPALPEPNRGGLSYRFGLIPMRGFAIFRFHGSPGQGDPPLAYPMRLATSSNDELGPVGHALVVGNHADVEPGIQELG